MELNWMLKGKREIPYRMLRCNTSNEARGKRANSPFRCDIPLADKRLVVIPTEVFNFLSNLTPLKGSNREGFDPRDSVKRHGPLINGKPMLTASSYRGRCTLWASNFVENAFAKRERETKNLPRSENRQNLGRIGHYDSVVWQMRNFRVDRIVEYLISLKFAFEEARQVE